MGIPTLLSTATPSNASSVDITSGIDSTYDEYMFVFSLHNDTNDNVLWFQFNASGGSGFNETITSTYFQTNHAESGGTPGLSYSTGADLAQGTGYQYITHSNDSSADAISSGVLHLFNPSNTTYVKHFYGRGIIQTNTPYAGEVNFAGYINTTSAIDEISFAPSNGTFDGFVQMYGIS